ncbi:MAG: DUF393 domain-containing protein [Mycobacteriales bacterium]
MPAAEPTLVFDGDCAFCSACARWIGRNLPRQPVVVPWQHADLTELGLTAAQCTYEVQWVSSAGRVGGADAVALLLIFQRRLWALLGRLMLLPGVVRVARIVYRWVARHRDRMPGGTAACAITPADRGPE